MKRIVLHGNNKSQDKIYIPIENILCWTDESNDHTNEFDYCLIHVAKDTISRGYRVTETAQRIDELIQEADPIIHKNVVIRS